MPLQGPVLKQLMQQRIYQGLKRVFEADTSQGTNYDPVADAHWMKMADAISDAAMDIVSEIQGSAQVVPGQQVVGVGGGVPGPVTGATVSPGTII